VKYLPPDSFSVWRHREAGEVTQQGRGQHDVRQILWELTRVPTTTCRTRDSMADPAVAQGNTVTLALQPHQQYSIFSHLWHTTFFTESLKTIPQHLFCTQALKHPVSYPKLCHFFIVLKFVYIHLAPVVSELYLQISIDDEAEKLTIWHDFIKKLCIMQ